MSRFVLTLSALSIALVGCSASAPSGGSAGTVAPTPALSPPEATPITEVAAAPVAGNEIALTPENTRIQFVGIHAGDKPDPRTGTFGKFSGKAAVDAGTLKSIQVDIDTASLSTEIEKLTNHLKSPDFFDVREHPQAKFVSSTIEPADEGQVTITGDLTLLKVTKAISFPATVSTENGLTLKAEFPIDRTEFGMNYSPDKVGKEVAMTITVGK